MTIPSESIFRIAIVALGGAAVGLEREWSGHVMAIFVELWGSTAFRKSISQKSSFG